MKQKSLNKYFLNKKGLIAAMFLVFCSGIPGSVLVSTARAQAQSEINSSLKPNFDSSAQLNFGYGFSVIHQSQNNFDPGATQQLLPGIQNAQTPEDQAKNFAQNTFAYSNLNESGFNSIIVGQVKSFAPLSLGAVSNRSIAVIKQNPNFQEYAIEGGSNKSIEKAIVPQSFASFKLRGLVSIEKKQNNQEQKFYTSQLNKETQFNLRC